MSFIVLQFTQLESIRK